MGWFLGSTMGGALIALAFFIYHLRRGQFDEIEEPKYQMLRDKDN
jgi:nitrogen fixation-related uncharacterized protein